MITLILSRHGNDGAVITNRESASRTYFAGFWAMNNCTGYRADIIIVQDEPTERELELLRSYHFHRAGPKTIWINHRGEFVGSSYYMN